MHRWKFIRTGGVDQVVIRSGADIINLEHLDQKLWVALACPARGLELDARTLDLIDSDDDGRVREWLNAWLPEQWRYRTPPAPAAVSGAQPPRVHPVVRAPARGRHDARPASRAG